MDKEIRIEYDMGGKTTIKSDWHPTNILVSQNKFYFIHQGEFVLVINNKKTILKKGDLVLIPAMTRHSCYLHENKSFQKSWCHFFLKYNNYNFFNNLSLPYIIHLSKQEEINFLTKQFNNLFMSSNLPYPQKEIETTISLCNILSFYLNHCDVAIKKDKNETDIISQTVSYIKLHYNEQLTSSDLAYKLGYSTNYFIKLFKNTMGVTPLKYIKRKRLEEAKKLLLSTDLDINLIMQKVGFLDFSYFSKSFKARYGFSPQNYRNLYNNF